MALSERARVQVKAAQDYRARPTQEMHMRRVLAHNEVAIGEGAEGRRRFFRVQSPLIAIRTACRDSLWRPARISRSAELACAYAISKVTLNLALNFGFACAFAQASFPRARDWRRLMRGDRGGDIEEPLVVRGSAYWSFYAGGARTVYEASVTQCRVQPGLIASHDPRHDFVNRCAVVAEIMAMDALGFQRTEQALSHGKR
jgi:hypothetical protein